MMNSVLIDSDKTALKEIAFHMEQLNVNVMEAFTKPEPVLKFIREKRPDFVISEINLPKISGLKLAKAIRSEMPQIPIIFITNDPNYALEAFNIFPADYILKPIDWTRLSNTVQRVEQRVNFENRTESLKIQCFGDFKLFAGSSLVRFPTQKSEELLAYMICNYGEINTRNDILNSVFENNTQEKKIDNFHVTMHRLRDTLLNNNINKNSLSIGHDYTVQIGAGFCDYIDFYNFIEKNRMVNANNIGVACKIIDSLNREFLQNINSVWKNDKKEWVLNCAEELIIKTAIFYSTIRKYDKLNYCLKKLIEINPYSTYINKLSQDLLVISQEH